MKTRALTLALALALAFPGHAAATCAAPQPEHAQMVTPSLTQLPPGSGFVLRGSQLVSPDVTLTGPSTVALTGTEIAPHVLRFVLPPTIAPGRYEIAATYGRTSGAVGSIEVSASAAALLAPAAAPTGMIARTQSPGRWTPNDSVTLTLAAPTAHGVAIVFDWTVSGTRFGSVAWVNAQSRDATLGGTGHCGGYPFGATLPAHGDQVRAAFIDERGQMGPWATLTVR